MKTKNLLGSEDKALNLFSEMMIRKIESIQNDWKKPWFTEGVLSWPRNISGREYNGMNAFMLMMLCEEKGFKHPLFLTFDRCVALNYKENKKGERIRMKDEEGKELPTVHVMKGERSFPVFITTFTCVHSETKERIKYDDYKQMKEDDRKNYNVYPKMQTYYVFNIDQTNISEARPDMYKELCEKFSSAQKPASEGDKDNFRFPAVDSMIEKNLWYCPIKPKKGDDCYYSISKDEIVTPLMEQFKNHESFYSNLFHEVAHSTGASSRLNRLKGAAFGSAEYAREELVAEMTAALCATRYGMEKNIKDDSAAYLKSWLKSLGENPEFIKTVLMDVKRASSMMTQKIDEMIQVQESAEAAEKIEKKEDASQILKQFLDLKKKHPGVLVLFRCGDFYETYMEDARKASEVLGITLTKSSKTKDPEGKPLEMAGFPYHALDTYLPKLIRAGVRVAICDQIEAPKPEDTKKPDKKTSKVKATKELFTETVNA